MLNDKLDSLYDSVSLFLIVFSFYAEALQIANLRDQILEVHAEHYTEIGRMIHVSVQTD